MARRSSDIPKGRARRGPKPLLGDNPRDRLYEAALACFGRDGIRRTSMDDIAGEAGISRPSLYTYFASKDEIVGEVVARQASSILSSIRRRLPRDPEERLVEAAYLGIRASLDNEYVRLLLERDVAQTTGRIMESESIRGIQRDFWGPLLTAAHEAGVLRDDRPREELMQWIVLQQFALAIHGASFGIEDGDLRDRLRAYLLPALRG